MIKKISRAVRYIQLLRSGYPGLKASSVDTAEQLEQAQRLHAQVYLEHGYIDSGHVGDDGRISIDHDPYQRHSVYFVVSENVDGAETVVATARQINAKEKGGHQSFPALSELSIDNDVISSLESFPPNECVEISALSKKRGYTPYASLLLYREMWQYSIRHGHKLWIMACDTRAFSQLRFLFGDAFTQIGKQRNYMGSDVVPAVLEVDQSLSVLLGYAHGINPVRRTMSKELVKFFLTGLSAEYIAAKRQKKVIKPIKFDAQA